jgi:TRAP-type C4-dicarboxylate transport system permease small subunit
MVGRDKHIAVEYFVKKLFPTNIQDWIYLVTQSMVLIFLFSVIISGFPFAVGQWHMRATSTDIPKTFVYLSIPVSMSFMVFHILFQMISKLSSMGRKA